MKTTVPLRSLGLLLGLALLPATVAAQSFNIDLDTPSPPQLGGGAPSAGFGAAANQPGFWNRVNGGHFGLTALVDLAGNPTGAVLDAVLISGSYRAFNNPTNTGDYALLLNDCADLAPNGTYVFRGLANGQYRLFSYVVEPFAQVDPIEVNVLGASGPNPQIVTGPMPGNAFALGITHSMHDVLVTNGRSPWTSAPSAPRRRR